MKNGRKEPYLRYKAYSLNMAKQYKERKGVQAYIELLLSLVTISVFSIFALRPTLITITGLIKDINKKKETIAIMDKKIENERQAEELYNSHINQIKLIEQAIPAKPEPDTLINQLEGLIAQNPSNVDILSIHSAYLTRDAKATNNAKTKLEALPQNIPSLEFTINLSGNYQELSNFMKELSQLRRPIKIDSVTFGKEKVNKLNTLTLIVSSRTPYGEVPAK